jgi:hypothetical protein
MRDLSLRTMEARSWKAWQQDGLFDMNFGILILAIGVSAFVEALGASPPLRLVTLIVLQFGGVLFYWLAKRRYASPRQGAVRFAPPRVRRTYTLRFALAACVLLLAGLVASTALGLSPLRWFSQLGAYALPTAIALVVGLPLVAIATFLQFPRVLVHAALFIAAGFALTAAGHNFMSPIPGGIAFAACGSTSIAIGAFYFVRFLRHVPRADQEVPRDER